MRGDGACGARGAADDIEDKRLSPLFPLWYLASHCYICVMIAVVGTLQRMQNNCGKRVCDHKEAAFLLYNFTNEQAPLQYSLVMSYIAFFSALFTLCMSCAWQVSPFHADSVRACLGGGLS